MPPLKLDRERLQKAIDAAVRVEAERILDQLRARMGEQITMRLLCEARDPFFPREQPEDET